MNGFSDDFLWFLEKNYASDFYKVKDETTKPDVLASIYASHCEEFRQWETVPLTLRLEYQGKLPEKIKELARQGNYEELRHEAAHLHPEDNVDYNNFRPTPEQFATASIVAFMAAAEANGYSPQAQYDLASERILRDTLRDKALNNTLTPQERQAWLDSRERTRNIIHRDWMEHSPERMLIHLFSKFNAGKISAEELSPRATELMKRINYDRREHLVAYIQKRHIQSKISKFDDHIVDMFMQTVLEVTPDQLKEMKQQALSKYIEPKDLMKNDIWVNMPQDMQARIAARNMNKAEQKMNTIVGNSSLSSAQKIQNMPSILASKQQNVNS